ncbi:MAG: YpdA family putative bacillithiol disulfide reductase [Bacteroidota bacterium]
MIDVLVIGAGPSGLSCSIEAKKAGLSTVMLEKGSLVDYIRRFPTNLVWFSTPELLEIGNVPFVVSTVRPTRVDTLNYYQKVAKQFGLDIRSHDAAVSLERIGDHFAVTTETRRVYEAKNVVVATGYFDNPNRLGVPGESHPNVLHYYNEPFDYFGCDVTVIGGRNSAVEAALDLYRHGARVTLVHRRERLNDGVKYWILPDIENRIKAGEIKALWNSTVKEITPSCTILSTPAGEKELKHDYAFVLIGYHPDTALLQKFGVTIQPETLAPTHGSQTFETNIPGLYVAGSVVAGKNNNKVFVENGRMHGLVIVKAILARG